MLARIAQTIARFRMFEPGQRVGVAVSGGADSVCLLHALRELSPEWNLRLSVLHLDHGLRGEESRGDAAFVEALAGAFNYPFHLRRAEIAAAPDNLEQAARDARYAFFREFLDSGQLDRVALGHTRSDQAETVLFRFLRGAGTAGLAGIRPAVNGLVRPLLELDRAEIEAWLRGRGIAWREDSTNQDPGFARNRIRHELLPRLAAEWNPALPRLLANTAEWAREEEAWWEAELDRLTDGRFEEKRGVLIVNTLWLGSLPLAAARRVIRRAMERVKGNLRSVDFVHVEGVLALAASTSGHGRFQAPGLDALRSFEWLRLARPGEFSLETRNFRFPLPVPGRAVLPDTTVLVAEVIDITNSSRKCESVYNEVMVGGLDAERLNGALQVRNWRPGDQYRPQGFPGEVKVKFLFQEAKVPLWERRHWPVVTSGEAIVWVKGFGPAAGLAAAPDAGHVLCIRQVAE